MQAGDCKRTVSHLDKLVATCEDKPQPTHTMGCMSIGPTVYLKASDPNGGDHTRGVLKHIVNKYVRGSSNPDIKFHETNVWYVAPWRDPSILRWYVAPWRDPSPSHRTTSI